MIIKNFNNLDRAKNSHGILSTKLYDRDQGVIMHLLLKPKESLKPHITPVDVVFYVVAGQPSILIGDEKVQVNQDDLIESPKDIVHCIYNDTDKEVRVLVMKLPKPEKKQLF